MTNSVIQWNDELSVLIVKHNLQETFLKDTDNIAIRGFNLYHRRITGWELCGLCYSLSIGHQIFHEVAQFGIYFHCQNLGNQ